MAPVYWSLWRGKRTAWPPVAWRLVRVEVGKLRDNDRATRVTLRGDLDVYRANEIATMLHAMDIADRIIIDCSDVRYADSAFIVALMRFRREFTSRGGDPLNIIEPLIPAADFKHKLHVICGIEEQVRSVLPSTNRAANRSAAGELVIAGVFAEPLERMHADAASDRTMAQLLIVSASNNADLGTSTQRNHRMR